jgi:hypothetical protein
MIGFILAATLQTADVLISAGHEGRPASCVRYPKRACNLGTAGEREWNPIVADEATRVLREHGVSVLREPADFDGEFQVDAAIFIHFDGNEKPCASGASIGYHSKQSVPAARLWKEIYSAYFPGPWEPDNFTSNLENYYGFRQVDASDAALVLELGELTCPAQRAWLEPRLKFDGDLLAYFLSHLIGKGDVPLPKANTVHDDSSVHRAYRDPRSR